MVKNMTELDPEERVLHCFSPDFPVLTKADKKLLREKGFVG